MSKHTDLTPEALAGYISDGRPQSNPHLATSACWYAFELGRQLGVNRRPMPTEVRMGRGDSIWANGARWRIEPGTLRGVVRFVRFQTAAA